MSHILIILRIRILGIAGLYLPEHRAFVYRNTELLFTRTQSFVLAAFATLVCQRNCVFLCKDTKLKIVMPVFAFASGNSYFINSLVQKHKNSACAEFLG